MTHFLALGPEMIVLIVVLTLVCFLVSLIALVDILRSSFKEKNDKLIWVLIVIFLGIIGAFIYLIIGRSQRVKQP